MPERCRGEVENSVCMKTTRRSAAGKCPNVVDRWNRPGGYGKSPRGCRGLGGWAASMAGGWGIQFVRSLEADLGGSLADLLDVELAGLGVSHLDALEVVVLGGTVVAFAVGNDILDTGHHGVVSTGGS